MSHSRTFGQTDNAVLSVDVASVIVTSERRASVKDSVVTLLMGSLERRGLLSPIRIREDGTLVCGLHRLIAHERLGWIEIEALVCQDADPIEIELDEIEENLCRKELTVLERARDELRQKELYVLRNPTTRRGTAGAVARHEGVQAKRISFAGARAREAASGKRIVEQRLQIATALRDDDAAKLAGLPIADNHTQLLELARVPRALRSDVAERIADGRANKVKEAVQQVITPRGEQGALVESPIVRTPASEATVDLRACPTEVVLGGRRLRVEVVDDDHVRLTDRGSATGANSDRVISRARASKARRQDVGMPTGLIDDALSGPSILGRAATSLTLQCDAAALRSALTHVAAVKPRALQMDGRTGYLVTVEDGCAHLYSTGERCVARAQLRVRCEQAGRFILPLELAQSLMASTGEVAVSSQLDGSTFRVRCRGSAADLEMDSFDPRVVPADTSGDPTRLKVIDSAVLGAALDAVAPFISKDPAAEQHFQRVHVYAEPARANGYAFGSDGMQAVWFYSEALRGLDMTIERKDIPLVRRFLAKHRRIAISRNDAWFFANDDFGRVLRWRRCPTHPEFSYYALANDSLVLRVPRLQILERITALLPVAQGRRITMVHVRASKVLHLGLGVDSAPISVELIKPHDTDVSARVSPQSLQLLFAAARGEWVELRVGIVPGAVFVRSIDDFTVGETHCRVTRFAPGFHINPGDR